jgi:esterase/lipase
MNVKYIILVCLMYVYSSFIFAQKKDIFCIEHNSLPVSEKEAILILPGFGSKIHGVNHIKQFFSNKGYDLFIPHYIGRDSLQQCVTTLNLFIESHHLLHYKKIHVFSYIAGSWVINLWMQQHPINNIASIVYDRSPLQERAPYVLVKDNPKIIKWLAGNIMKQFSQTPYPTITKDEKNLGIIIENKSTKLIRKHKKTALTLGPIYFDKDSLHQSCDDYFYTCMNHDEMYFNFETIGKEIFLFFKTGRFSENVQKNNFNFDIWNKHAQDCQSK